MERDEAYGAYTERQIPAIGDVGVEHVLAVYFDRLDPGDPLVSDGELVDDRDTAPRFSEANRRAKSGRSGDLDGADSSRIRGAACRDRVCGIDIFTAA